MAVGAGTFAWDRYEPRQDEPGGHSAEGGQGGVAVPTGGGTSQGGDGGDGGSAGASALAACVAGCIWFYDCGGTINRGGGAGGAGGMGGGGSGGAGGGSGGAVDPAMHCSDECATFARQCSAEELAAFAACFPVREDCSSVDEAFFCLFASPCVTGF